MDDNTVSSTAEVFESNQNTRICTSAFPNVKNVCVYRKIIQLLLKCYENNFTNTATLLSESNEESPVVLSKPYQCYHCRGEYDTKLSMRKHLLNCEIRINQQESTKNNYVDYLCAKCRKIFRTTQALKYHMKVCQIYEVSVGDFSTCNTYFQTVGELNKHLMVCKNTSPSKNCTHPKPFTCKICKKRFEQARYLVNHVITHSDFDKYKCTKCNRGFKDPSGFNRHLKTHNKKPSFICAHCGKALTRRIVLKKHLYSHICGRLFKCRICKKPHENAKSLSKHMINHPPVKRTKFSQMYLDQKFKIHTRVHLNTNRFECKLCSTSFSERDKLVEHFETIHKSGTRVYTNNQFKQTIKEFRCETCKKIFMYCHKNIKKHKCNNFFFKQTN